MSSYFIQIKHELSHARLATYEKYTTNTEQALALYQWNTQISASLFEQIQFLEITLRNAICEALHQIIGDKWVWNTSFAINFPKQTQKTLQKLANDKQIKTLDQAIPHLHFAFWQSLFTSRFDHKIWHSQLHLTFPNAPNIPYKTLREEIYQNLDNLRELRNRIAHHEPIFQRDLQKDFDAIHKLIGYRSLIMSDWARQAERVTQLLQNRP